MPAEVYDAYEKLAHQTRKPIDQVFSERLTQCVGHQAQKPIYLTDPERQRLEKACGQSLSGALDVAESVEKAMRLTLGGISVPLNADLVDRLRSRCFEPNFGKWVAQLAVEKLEEYTGIR